MVVDAHHENAWTSADVAKRRSIHIIAPNYEVRDVLARILHSSTTHNLLEGGGHGLLCDFDDCLVVGIVHVF